MTLTFTSLITILGMLVITYSTRLAGFFLFRNRKLNPKMTRVMEVAPACVLISVIAPHFVSDKPHEIISLLITIVAAWRLPMLQTVLVAIGSSALFAYLFKFI